MPTNSVHTPIDEVRISHRLDVGVRAAVVLSAGITAGLGATPWLRTPLVVLAAVVAGETLVRRRRLGRMDAVLVVLGGVLAALVLLGFLLDVFPSGLGRVPWAIGATILALAAVGWGAVRDPSYFSLNRRHARTLIRVMPWLVAVVAATAAALLISTHATDVAVRAPVQLSATTPTASDASVVVTIAAGAQQGRYDLEVRAGHDRPRRYGPFELSDGGSAHIRVPLASVGTTRVDLHRDGSDTVMSSLVLTHPRSEQP